MIGDVQIEIVRERITKVTGNLNYESEIMALEKLYESTNILLHQRDVESRQYAMRLVDVRSILQINVTVRRKLNICINSTSLRSD